MIILLICLVLAQQEIKIISEKERPKNLLLSEPQQKEPGQNEEQVDRDAAPAEYSLKSGTLYKISDSEWYLRAVDQVTKSTFLINLNDISRIKYIEKELEVEKKTEPPEEQTFKDFEWTPLIAYEAFPKNRGGHSMHNIGDYVVLFGGCFLDIKCFNDLFLFNSRTKVWTNPKMFGTPPSGRTGFGACVNGAKLYIFGGHTLQGLVNDLYVFDIESRSWNQLFWPGIVPSPRSNHKMVFTSVGALSFGGYVGETYSNELFVMDVINERWGKPTAGGDVPLGRESFGMLYHHGVTYVFGGYSTGIVLNDLYTLTDDLVWEKKTLSGSVPTARQGIAMAEYDNRIFLVGGCNPKLGVCYNDLNVLDTTTMHCSSINAFQQKNLKKVEYAAMVFQGPLLMHFGGCEGFLTCSDSFLGLKIDDLQNCPKCYNGGTCRAGHCSCPEGYQGIDCTVKVLCRQNCLNQGFCMSNGYCRCYPGYSGSVCQILIPCPSNCTDAEHGKCLPTGECKCEKGFTGDGCNGDEKALVVKVECENDCNGKGDCNKETGLCACEDGFSGPDCSLVDGEDADADDYKSIWQLLNDDDADPEKGTTTLRLQEFLANGFKFQQREEGPVPIFDDDVDKVYYTQEGDPIPNVNQQMDQPRYQNNIQSNIYLDQEPMQLDYDLDELADIHLDHQDHQGQHNHHHDHHHHEQSENSSIIKQRVVEDVREETLQTISDYNSSLTLTSIPPKKVKYEEQEFELLPVVECPKKCNEHGVCIKHECYCWYGYTGNLCQASKIKDFYIGVRRRKLIIWCSISFLIGILAGYIGVLWLQKRGVQDEFKGIDHFKSNEDYDNIDGEAEEKIV